MRKLFLFLIVILFLGTVTGTSIRSENVTVDLANSEIDVEMYVKELTSSSLSYITEYKVENVEAEINGSRTSCDVKELREGSDIECKSKLKKDFIARLNFETDSIITRKGTKTTFSYEQPIYRPVGSYRLRAVLPPGMGLLMQEGTNRTVVEPSDYREGSDGRRIFIEWKKDPELGGEPLRFKADYRMFSQDFKLNEIIFAVSGAIIFIFITYLLWRKRNRESIESVYGDITEDEKEVVEILREEDGEMLQKDVVERSDYSKAKISGTVSSLVEKDVLEKEKEGRSNKLKILKKYRV